MAFIWSPAELNIAFMFLSFIVYHLGVRYNGWFFSSSGTDSSLARRQATTRANTILLIIEFAVSTRDEAQ